MRINDRVQALCGIGVIVRDMGKEWLVYLDDGRTVYLPKRGRLAPWKIS